VYSRVTTTLKDVLLDQEVDNLYKVVNSLPKATTAAAAATTTTQTFASQFVLSLSSADGATSLQVTALQVDTSTGLTLSQSGAAGVIGLILIAGTGIGITGATISNTGVTSFNGATGAVTTTPGNLPITTVTGSTTLLVTGSIYLVDATAGAIVITVPVSLANKSFYVKKIDATANTVTITPSSGLIDGAATRVLASQYSTAHFASDGTNLWII
jgi:hypothetical protein